MGPSRADALRAHHSNAQGLEGDEQWHRRVHMDAEGPPIELAVACLFWGSRQNYLGRSVSTAREAQLWGALNHETHSNASLPTSTCSSIDDWSGATNGEGRAVWYAMLGHNRLAILNRDASAYA